MKKFLHVEDYIEVINGDRDPATGNLYGLFNGTSPIVSLARYDVQVLSNMSNTTTENRALTDRQAELAVKIILKYRRQLEKLNIDVSPVETNPQFRIPLRTIDRRRILEIDNDYIILRFPYTTGLIDDIRDLAKTSNGFWQFDSTNKVWKIAITEPNVVAAAGFAANNQFEISEEFKKLLETVIACESVPYEIKLIHADSGYTIQNADNNLINYIKDSYCGFNKSNIDLLVDNAPVFGYTVDQSIKDEIVNKYFTRVFNLMMARESKFNPDVHDDVVNDIVRYAEVSGRFPIYIYEPNLSDRLFKKFAKLGLDTLKVRELNNDYNITGKKIIHFTKYNVNWEKPIPLLISAQGMMHGGEKTMLLQTAEKIVYFVTEVYNKNNLRNN